MAEIVSMVGIISVAVHTFKNIQIYGLSDCLAKGVKILDGMKFIQMTNLKLLRLKIFRFTDFLIAWLRELKSLMA